MNEKLLENKKKLKQLSWSISQRKRIKNKQPNLKKRKHSTRKRICCSETLTRNKYEQMEKKKLDQLRCLDPLLARELDNRSALRIENNCTFIQKFNK